MKFPLSFYKLVMAAAVALPTMALATITPATPQQDTDNCYMIGSAAELYGFAKMVNDGSGFDGCGKLTADIVVNENVLGTDNANVNASGAYTGDDSNFDKWAPINGFAGKFHGQGHTISGLYFNDPEKEKVGLFGNVGGVEINGLGLVDSYFGGSFNVGGFVGYADGTVYIRNSYNSSVVRGHSVGNDWWCGVGGFVGVAEVKKIEIENSYNLGFVTGGPAVGGLVGIIKVDENFSVSNSYNAGDVKGTAEDVGGLVGFVGFGYSVSDDVDAGIVSSYNTGSVVCGGEEGVGGLVGYLDEGFEILRIVNSYNTGTVDGNYAGGLVGGGGWGGVGYADVYNSYNAGFVNGGEGDALGFCDEVYNFYFLEGSSVGFGTQQSAKEFADGTVAEALHGYNENGVNGSVWGQGFGRDAHPTLTGAIGPALTLHVYEGVEIDSAYTPDTDLPKPTREGYEFLDWYAKSDFSGSAVTRIPSDATDALEYYAKWKALGGSGCIEIASADDLFSFAARVNGGDGEICGKLTDNITVNENVLTSDGVLNVDGSNFTPWTPIGTSSAPFKGTFYGQGHTISGLYYAGGRQATYANVGLFGYVQDKVVIDGVGIVDSYFFANNSVGALVGKVGGSSTDGTSLTISNSYNAGRVSVQVKYVGGLVGVVSSSVKINNSYNVGPVNGTNLGGGLVGSLLESATASINNSYNSGSLTVSEKTLDDLVYVNTTGTATATITNCFFTGKSQFEGNGATKKTAEEFANGTVAKALHDWCEMDVDACKDGGLDGSVWGQDVLNGDTLPNFSDKITGTLHDLVLHTFEGDSRVYPTKYLEETGFVLPTDLTREDYVFLGWYKTSDFSGSAVTEIPAKATGKQEYYAKWIKFVDNCYEIASADDLFSFAAIVNGGDGKICGKLTDDITVNKNVLTSDGLLNGDGSNFTSWTPIGTSSASFKGTFYGQGHTISGLYYSQFAVAYANVGLFGYVEGEVVIDGVGIVDSYFYANNSVGALVGKVGGSSTDGSSLTISNSYNAGFVGGNTGIGGLVGGVLSSVVINNSYNAGFVNGANKSLSTGGLVGSLSESATASINNSYNAGSVTGKSEKLYDDLVFGTGEVTVTNSFYIGESQFEGGGATKKTAEEFANGSVAKALHDWCEKETGSDKCKEGGLDGSVWGQDVLNGDPLPNFSDKITGTLHDLVLHTFEGDSRVYPTKYLEETGFVLPTDLTREDYVFLGWYKTSDFSGSAVTEIPAKATGKQEYYAKWIKFVDNCYEIASADDLFSFAAIVNGGDGKICGKLTDDITVNKNVLTSDGSLNGDCSNFTPWTPIGTSGAQFKGTFDGQGHTISGLYFKDDNANDVGLFGYVGKASIQNVGVVDSYFKGGQHVGGVVGEMSGSITNCYNKGVVSGTKYVGGVLGMLNEGSISNVYNVGSVSGNEFVGGVVGNVESENTVSNVYNIGSVSGSKRVGGVAGACADEVSVNNAFYNKDAFTEDAIGEYCEGNFDNVEGRTASEFANGSVAKALHDWCEKDGDNCKVGGLDGSVWGQDLSKENSLPEFIKRLDYKMGGMTFFELAGKIDSAYVDAASDIAVNFPNDVVVSGPVKFKRSFPTMGVSNGYSTIMLPFTPKFETDADTIEGVNFYAFSNYEKATISVTPVKQMNLEANTPYLVKAAGAAELVFGKGGTFNTTTGGVSENGYKVELSGTGWTIFGTYEYKKWEEGDEGLGKTYGFVGAGGNEASEVGKFKKAGAGAYIYPMRAYLKYEGELPKGAPRIADNISGAIASLPETINVVIDVAGDASDDRTVIGTISTRTGEFKFATDRWFDLNGRYLGSKKPTQKGAYYNNGKKVIVK